VTAAVSSKIHEALQRTKGTKEEKSAEAVKPSDPHLVSSLRE
jgi:hypothetical protein